MGRRILDPKIVAKFCKATRLEPNAVRVKVSQLASKKRVTSEVALVVLAHQHGIGTAVFQRSLDPGMHAAIRDALDKPEPVVPRAGSAKVSKTVGKRSTSRRDTIKNAIELLIDDHLLRSKCADILLARVNYDRPINQAPWCLKIGFGSR